MLCLCAVILLHGCSGLDASRPLVQVNPAIMRYVGEPDARTGPTAESPVLKAGKAVAWAGLEDPASPEKPALLSPETVPEGRLLFPLPWQQAVPPVLEGWTQAQTTPANIVPVPKPEGERVPLTLDDAIAWSLRQCDVVRVLSGGSVALAPGTIYDAEARDLRLKASEAMFDPFVEAGYIGGQIDQPPGAFFGPGIPVDVRRDEGDFYATITKPWATGGVTRAGYDPPLGYLFVPGGGMNAFNPSHTSAFVLESRQPLLRGAGVGRNTAPIRIAQMQAEQSHWEVRQAALAQVRSVEEAYWDLQASVIGLQAVEMLLPLSQEIVLVQHARQQAELITLSDVARAQAQRDEFQQRHARMLAAVKTREYRLRNLLALPIDDGVRLFPVDPPEQKAVILDPQASLELALANQPDLMQQRIDVAIREQEVTVASNNVRPQLDLIARGRMNGLNDTLGDSLEQAWSGQYTDWTLGAMFAMPLGNRAARVNCRGAELQLFKERVVLDRLQDNLGFQIAGLIREIQGVWDQYQLTQRRLRETEEWARASRTRFAFPNPDEAAHGNGLTVGLVDYQQSLIAHLEAVSESATLLAEYNTLLARLREIEGTLLTCRSIEWSDQPVK